jgi:hypothetical protein
MKPMQTPLEQIAARVLATSPRDIEVRDLEAAVKAQCRLARVDYSAHLVDAIASGIVSRTRQSGRRDEDRS